MLEEFQGQRGESSIFFYGNEAYHLDSRDKDKPEKCYRCINRTTDIYCRAAIIVLEDGNVTRVREHNHVIDDELKSNIIFRLRIKELAENIQLEPMDVFRQAARE